MRCYAAVIITFLVSCEVANEPTADRDGDPELFSETIQPILESKCGFLGCHGREGMPLTLYGVHYLRLRDPDGLVDETRPALEEHKLTAVEVAHNRRALALRIGPDDPSGDRERFLQRLIGKDQGGMPHAGTVVFERADDPQLRALRDFLETVKER